MIFKKVKLLLPQKVIKVKVRVKVVVIVVVVVLHLHHHHHLNQQNVFIMFSLTLCQAHIHNFQITALRD